MSLEASVWLYIDNEGSQKGPLPHRVIATLLQKQILSGNTLVWKDGMEEWKPTKEIEDFQEIVKILDKQWLYLDMESQQHGPMLAQKLLHRLHEGSVDGMTLVWSDDLPEWQPLGEVSGFKQLIQITAPEPVEIEEGEKDTAEVFDEDKVFAGLETAAEVDVYHAPKKAGKQRYVGDDGTRYILNEETGEWEETQEEFSESEGEEEKEEMEEAWKARRREKQKKQKEEEEKQKKEKEQKATAENKSETSSGEKVTSNNDSSENQGPQDDKEKKEGQQKPKRKRKGSRKKRGLAWNDKASNTWIYVTGLPVDVTMEELKTHFSQTGVLATDPLTQTPKVKVYRDKQGRPKGDASICYAKKESVDLATTVLDGGLLRPDFPITVKKAEFKQKGEKFDPSKRQRLNSKQVKIAKQAQENALSWNDEEDTGSRHKLTIVVLKNMFKPEEFKADPSFQQELEEDLSSECGKLGDIEKVTCFEKNPQGVVVIKFKTSFAAEECVKLMDGRWYGGQRITCTYWDGVTNFLITADNADGGVDEVEEQQRLDEFGDWLENQDLPDEFKFQVEGGDDDDDDDG